ncbi:MAG: TIR domain-containing protein [Sphingobacteriaceae bacterium]|nr:TIR domain-containing protein [Sphingobacteriaceae bacterium]
MAKRVFFSFHYDDVKTFRANVVRNHHITKDAGEAGFFDASIWEDAKKHGDDSIKRLINTNLNNTSVTCALIGTNTWSRRWVRYEILKSYDRGNTLFGVHINGITDKNKQTFPFGTNVFDHLGFFISADGQTLTYYERDQVGSEWKLYTDLPPKKNCGFAEQWRNRGYNFSNWVPIYNWCTGDGYNNFATWVDSAK